MKKLTKQRWGLIYSFIACVLFWVPLYETREWFLFIPYNTKGLSLLPSLASGLIALVFVFLLYVRGIIVFKSKKIKIPSMILNWAVFSTFIEILISPYASNSGYTIFQDNAILILFTIITGVVLVCGVKEIAKIVVLMFLLGSFFTNLIVVSEAMGFLGFLALGFVIGGFYLQQNITLEGLKNEFEYLFLPNTNKQIQQTKETTHVKQNRDLH